MKTIRELQEIVGVSRKTLRGYDEMGLLSPAEKLEDGNHTWLYEDNAVERLGVIQIFTEAGYSRKEIKEFLSLPLDEQIEEFDRLTALLEEKRDRINNLIGLVKKQKEGLIYLKKHPSNVEMFDISNLFQNKNLSELMNSALTSETFVSKISETPLDEGMLYYSIIALAKECKKDPPSVILETYVQELHTQCLHAVLSDLERKGKPISTPLSNSEAAVLVINRVKSELSNKAIYNTIEMIAGNGSAEFVLNTLINFEKSQYGLDENNLN